MFHVIPDILYPADIVPPINQLLVIPDMSDQLLYLFSRTTRLFLVIPDMLFSRAMFLVIPDMLFSRTTHLFLVLPDILYPAGIFSHGQLTRFSSSRTHLTSNSIFFHGQLACFLSSWTYLSPGQLTCFSSSRTCCAQLVSFLPDTSLVTSPDRLLLSRLWQTFLLYHELQHLI